MNLSTIDPLSDARWNDLVRRHPRASAFHERGWLEALARTYGYEPFVLTGARVGEPLRNGIVLCRVSSWITGTRVVSLPFSDHCDFLLNDPTEWGKFLDVLRSEIEEKHYRYLELRPLSQVPDPGSDLRVSDLYWFHSLDLRPSLEQIFEGLHRSSIQRKIHRAEREGLSYEVGRSALLLEEFYSLLIITRRRHGRFPQPRSWFRNLIECLGEKIQIRLARKNGHAIAATLTLHNRSSVVYKYGGSDERFHNLGGMPFLFWKLIEDSKTAGAEDLDLGRTDLSQEGLITFKDRLGASRRLLKYYRLPPIEQKWISISNSRAFKHLVVRLPDSVMSAAGNALYKHLG